MAKQVSLPPPRRSVAPRVEHPGLVELAQRTKKSIQWNQILRGSDATSAQWKWLENERSFSIYTKQDRSKHFGVLAIGVVKGSVPEIASLLVTTSQGQYVRNMEALYEKSFKHGMYVHDVASDVQNETLSVRSATFEKLGGWKPRNDEWQHLELTTYDRERQVLEKQLTTLAPHDVVTKDIGSMCRSSSKTKQLSDVTAAFRIEPDQYQESDVPPGMEDPRVSSGIVRKPRVATRVHFYAEYAPGSTSLKASLRAYLGRLALGKLKKNRSSEKATKRRLLNMAKSCDRLSLLVLRRRLGMQVIVDQKRFLQMTRSTCFCCDQKLGMLTKLCRVCGQGVCRNCSAKYERETHAHRTRGGRVHLESIRVCDPCLARVDSADYSCMSDVALMGPGVQPNPPSAAEPATDLKGLLREALLQAPSPSKKDAVMSVIRCVLDQEQAIEDAATPRSQLDDPSARVLLTPVSDDQDYVDSLDYLDIKAIPHDEAVLANEEGRAYAIDARTGDADGLLSYPVPANETERVAAIEQSQILGHGAYPELDIICDIAAKELGSAMSVVSIVGADEQFIIGANKDALHNLVLKREDTFCAHTIMSNAPLEVPHPAADIRFSKITQVASMGAQYYCGFPLVADDEHGSVIGALCVIDDKANVMNESQYAVLQRLAATASKVVRLEGAKRQSNISMASM